VCGVVEKEDNNNKKMNRDFNRKRNMRSNGKGESLVVQLLQTENGSRGLLPSI
jgi:hypothetical protein